MCVNILSWVWWCFRESCCRHMPLGQTENTKKMWVKITRKIGKIWCQCDWRKDGKNENHKDDHAEHRQAASLSRSFFFLPAFPFFHLPQIYPVSAKFSGESIFVCPIQRRTPHFFCTTTCWEWLRLLDPLGAIVVCDNGSNTGALIFPSIGQIFWGKNLCLL